jgi:inorganic triphosphatase YgiF
MTDAPLEIEAKFSVDDADRQHLAEMDVVGEYAVTGRASLDQRDLYFDTTDAHLAQSGATLRVRWNEKGVFMTFKGRRAAQSGPDDLHVAARLEDEVRLPEEFGQRVSVDAELPDAEGLSPLARAREVVGQQSLVPVADIRNVRQSIDLDHPGGERFELSLDRCVATRLSDGRIVSFGEVELEAKTAERQRLIELSEALRAVAPSLTPSHTTKLERVLGGD